MKTIVDGEDRIVRVSIKTIPREVLNCPDRWVQIEIVVLRDDPDKCRVKRVKLKLEELEEIARHVKMEVAT